MSASANKLANLKQQAASYAALIMEELDPDHLGYIEVNFADIPYFSSFIHFIFIFVIFVLHTDVAARNSTEGNGKL